MGYIQNLLDNATTETQRVRLKWLLQTSKTKTDKCIEWPWPRSSGYGHFYFRGKHMLTHRIILTETAGPNPPGRDQAGHQPLTCHNRACCNPNHLRWVSQSENNRDAIKDGSYISGFQQFASQTGLHPVTKKPLYQKGLPCRWRDEPCNEPSTCLGFCRRHYVTYNRRRKAKREGRDYNKPKPQKST